MKRPNPVDIISLICGRIRKSQQKRPGARQYEKGSLMSWVMGYKIKNNGLYINAIHAVNVRATKRQRRIGPEFPTRHYPNVAPRPGFGGIIKKIYLVVQAAAVSEGI